MFNKIVFAFRFLSYFFKSKHYYGHGIHSPFIYDFARNVLFKKSEKHLFSHIKEYRQHLNLNKQTVLFEDFGAGSKIINSVKRKVCDIAKTSSTKNKYGMLLARIIAYYKPKFIIELGTSLGIGTLYLTTLFGKNAKLYTVEGDKNVSKIANEYIKEVTTKNIHFINAKFRDAILELTRKNEDFDFIFFDGNHSEKATIYYFEQCLSKINDKSIFVFDDIHWSKGMENAWEYIKSHTKTKVCIDLFQFGIVFFKKELAKQNYMIRF